MISAFMTRHKKALRVVAVATTLDVVLGLAFGAADHIGVANGLYFATVTATTVGYGDILPHGWLPHVIAVVMMLTVIPLFGATFSLFTSGLTADNVNTEVRAEAQETRKHVEDRLLHHFQTAATK